LSTAFCLGIYLIIVVGVFGLTGPIKLAGKMVQDQLWRK
jgi:hypothetical protein